MVFVVRTMSWSLIARAGLWTYIAFFLAQVGLLHPYRALCPFLCPGCGFVHGGCAVEQVLNCTFIGMHGLVLGAVAGAAATAGNKSCLLLKFFYMATEFWTVQVFSTVIAAFGFNGYDYPNKPHNNSFDNCLLCRYAYKTTPGGYPKFFSRKVPQARTENMYIDSTIGCT